MKSSPRITISARRLVRNVEAQPKARWFSNYEIVYGFRDAERCGLVVRDGDYIRLTDAGREWLHPKAGSGRLDPTVLDRVRRNAS